MELVPAFTLSRSVWTSATWSLVGHDALLLAKLLVLIGGKILAVPKRVKKRKNIAVGKNKVKENSCPGKKVGRVLVAGKRVKGILTARKRKKNSEKGIIRLTRS